MLTLIIVMLLTCIGKLPCQTNALLFFTCGFETNGTLCGFTQDTTDDFDWTWQQDHTSSSHTGPSGDHTYQHQYHRHGHYMYTEASAKRQDYRARLISPTFTGKVPLCLTLYYNMYGHDIGSLNVFTQTTDGQKDILLSISGDQGDQWNLANVTVPLPTVLSGFTIVFEGITGNGFQGDIAIDDISLEPGNCDSVASVFSCDFEDNATLCGFTQDTKDDFDWSRQYGQTPSQNTGPLTDHTFNNQYNSHGHYMYTEASSPQKKDDKALLMSPFFIESMPLCLMFYYNMHGNHIGSLHVFIQTRDGHRPTSFSIWGYSGTEWHLAQVNISQSTAKIGFQVVFEGIIGDGFLGDIAIDDVSVLRGQCSSASTGNMGYISWSTWSAWSACSLSCGTGVTQRTRMCISNVHANRVGKCNGNDTETQACNGNPCRVDGGWTTWSLWGTCSVSCGGGLKQRTRSCINPVPKNNGTACVGYDKQAEVCNRISCPVSAAWSTWSPWSACTLSCGAGLKQRTRTCNDPYPVNNAAACTGHDIQSEVCNRIACPGSQAPTSWITVPFG